MEQKISKEVLENIKASLEASIPEFVQCTNVEIDEFLKEKTVIWQNKFNLNDGMLVELTERVDNFKDCFYDLYGEYLDTDKVKQILKTGDGGLSNLFYLKWGNMFSLADHKRKEFYVWCSETKLWSLRSHIDQYIAKRLIGYLKLFIVFLEQNDDPDKEGLKIIEKHYESINKTAIQKTTISRIINVLVENKTNCKDTLQFNIQKDLLPIQNKLVLNLETGICRPRTRNDFFTIECPVTYNEHADTTLIEKFFRDITLDNKELYDFLQVLLGYSITGLTKEHILPIFHGASGRNGKSLCISLMNNVLGKFSHTANKNIFINTNSNESGSACTNYLADLKNKRFITFTETKREEKLNDVMIKRATGHDVITANPKYGSTIEFKLVAKMFMITNNIPKMDNDTALWSRLLLIPFNATFVKEPNLPNEKQIDLDLEEKLSTPEQKSALLKWLLQGSMKYYQNGLVIPECVKAKTSEHRIESDYIAQYIKDRCNILPKGEKGTTTKVLHDDFKDWCSINGYTNKSIIEFGTYLKNNSLFMKKILHGYVYYNISIKPQEITI
jgi:P4 family phage/plasmid primase-like protien